MNDREQLTHTETPYQRVKRFNSGGNWMDAAAKMLTDPDEIKEYIAEATAEYFREDRPHKEYGHTPNSWVESIRTVINGLKM